LPIFRVVLPAREPCFDGAAPFLLQPALVGLFAQRSAKAREEVVPFAREGCRSGAAGGERSGAAGEEPDRAVSLTIELGRHRHRCMGIGIQLQEQERAIRQLGPELLLEAVGVSHSALLCCGKAPAARLFRQRLESIRTIWGSTPAAPAREWSSRSLISLATAASARRNCRGGCDCR